jgi:hypothetical protein
MSWQWAMWIGVIGVNIAWFSIGIPLYLKKIKRERQQK